MSRSRRYTHVSLRIDDELRAAVQAVADALYRDSGIRVTWSAAARALMREALEAHPHDDATCPTCSRLTAHDGGVQ